MPEGDSGCAARRHPVRRLEIGATGCRPDAGADIGSTCRAAPLASRSAGISPTGSIDARLGVEIKQCRAPRWRDPVSWRCSVW